MTQPNTDPGGSPNPAAGGAGQSGASGGAPTDGASRYAAVDEFIAARGGNARKAVRLLLKDNHGLREKLATRQAVPEGAIVLTGEDATDWGAYKALGVKPGDVKKQLDELPPLRAFKADTEHRTQMADVAKSVGFKGTVLADRMRATPGATLEQRPVTVQKDGKDEVTQVWHIVTGAGAAAKAEKLADYAAREWADYLPALRESESGGRGGDPPRRDGRDPAPRYFAQREGSQPASGAETKQVADGYLARTRVLPSDRQAGRDREPAGNR